MKKEIAIFILMIILPLISAVEINMNSEFSEGETILASVSGNFVDTITEENIQFYRGAIRTAFDFEVARIGNIYYIYAQSFGKSPNKYSINITEVQYIEDSKVYDDEFAKNFEIINQTADFSVNPGFVLEEGNFSLVLQNFQQSDLTINLDSELISGNSQGNLKFIFEGETAENSITLHSGLIKYLGVSVEEISGTSIRKIYLSTDNLNYEIPVYLILPDSEESETENEIPEENDTETEEQENETDSEDESEDDSCSFFDRLFGNCDTEDEEPENEINESDSDNETELNESEESDEETENEEMEEKITSESFASKTCAEISGEICASGTICKNKTITTKDADCCISSCVTKEEDTNKKIIGWLIIGVLFIILLWFFRIKFRKTKTKKDSLLGNSKK